MSHNKAELDIAKCRGEDI